MEKSFSPLEDLIAKRLLRVGKLVGRREGGTLSKPAKKKNAEEKPGVHEVQLEPDKELSQPIARPDFVRVEKNIAAFGFFTPSSKRIKNVPKIIRFTQTVDGNRVEAQVKILGNVEYGMPITADQDKYLAFQKIIERVKRERGTVSNPIAFTTAELVKLLGKSRAGHHYKEVEEWLKVMKGTVIESQGAVWIAGKKRFATDVFSLFDRIKQIGDELDDGGVADKNYVWLSSWYLENLNAHYLLPIDFETYKQLKNHVAKALVPLLQIWLYASREQGSFEKRYSELCQTLNIAEYNYVSKIKEKLAPSFDELVEYGYLDSWKIEKTSDEKDFKIIFKHGWKFYSDRKQSRLSSKKNAAKNEPLQDAKASRRPKVPTKGEKGAVSENFASSEVLAGEPNSDVRGKLPTMMTAGHLEAIQKLHIEYQIAYEKAVELVTKHFSETVRQLESFPFREKPPKNKAGFLIEAIEQKYSLPEAYDEHLRTAEERKIQETRRAKIEACSLCNESGWRNIKNEQDTFYGVMHQCTHDPEIESTLEEHVL